MSHEVLPVDHVSWKSEFGVVRFFVLICNGMAKVESEKDALYH